MHAPCSKSSVGIARKMLIGEEKKYRWREASKRKQVHQKAKVDRAQDRAKGTTRDQSRPGKPKPREDRPIAHPRR